MCGSSTALALALALVLALTDVITLPCPFELRVCTGCSESGWSGLVWSGLVWPCPMATNRPQPAPARIQQAAGCGPGPDKQTSRRPTPPVGIWNLEFGIRRSQVPWLLVCWLLNCWLPEPRTHLVSIACFAPLLTSHPRSPGRDSEAFLSPRANQLVAGCASPWLSRYLIASSHRSTICQNWCL